MTTSRRVNALQRDKKWPTHVQNGEKHTCYPQKEEFGWDDER
jgi:hypothetical protein